MIWNGALLPSDRPRCYGDSWGFCPVLCYPFWICVRALARRWMPVRIWNKRTINGVFFELGRRFLFFFNFFFISHPSGILPALPPIETFQRGIANLLFISLVTINQFPSRRGALHAAISRKTFWIDADCYKLKNKESHLSTSFGTFFYSFFFFLFVSFARMWCAVDIILPLVLFDNWIQFDKFFSHQSWLCGIEISNFKFFIQISNNKEKKLSKK